MTPDGFYDCPLLLKQLLRNALLQWPDQEIVYRDRRRMTYAGLGVRTDRLASALHMEMGVRPGDTVAVLDWDSHRFLEALFAVPMMGAVLQTVNVRLSAEQVAYTIGHTGASELLVNEDFAELVDAVRPLLPAVRRVVIMHDRSGDASVASGAARCDAEYEALLDAGQDGYDFPDFDENTQAIAFYTSGATGLPKCVGFTHRGIVLHTLAPLARLGLAPRQGRFDRSSVYTAHSACPRPGRCSAWRN